ncbi:MAG: hypothetical protein N3B16_12425 [Candidatus Aminicenantes bacterium]|nr:hypothetical protein [Candidatus Aminicenantes bacterium]
MSQQSRLHLRVIARGKFLVDEEVEEVLLPGVDGQIGILPGHRPLVLGLGSGNLAYRQGNKESHLSVDGGYATISAREVIVFIEGAQELKRVED